MKICLIGSTRFMENYVAANRELTLKGHVVYTVATITTASAMSPTADSPITEDEKTVLDLVHLRKIQESDAVCLVTDETGYYGFSTKREMLWSTMIDKPILVYVPTKPMGSMFQWGNLFGGRALLEIPSIEKVAEGWRKTMRENDEELRTEASRDLPKIMTPGGEG